MASSPPLIIVRRYNVQTCFEYLSRTKRLLKGTFKKFGGNLLIFQQLQSNFWVYWQATFPEFTSTIYLCLIPIYTIIVIVNRVVIVIVIVIMIMGVNIIIMHIVSD